MKIVILSIVAVPLMSCSQKTTSAEISGSEIIPYTMANGGQAQMVLINWKNTGTTNIRVVHADILAYDANDIALDSSVSNYTIYAAPNNATGVAPGDTYIEPKGEGFVLIPANESSSPAVRIVPKITKVFENSGF